MKSDDIRKKIDVLKTRITEQEQELSNLQSAIKENRSASLSGEPIDQKLNSKAAAIEYALKADRELIAGLHEDLKTVEVNEAADSRKTTRKTECRELQKHFEKSSKAITDALDNLKSALIDAACVPHTSTINIDAGMCELLNGQKALSIFIDSHFPRLDIRRGVREWIDMGDMLPDGTPSINAELERSIERFNSMIEKAGNE